MSRDDFVHLHLHTEYSLLDGESTLPKLVAEVARLGQPAVAITDHGSLAGAYQLWHAATEVGVKPIIGEEFYVAPRGMEHKEACYWGSPEQRSEDVGGTGAYTHLTVLSTGAEGLRNLFRLQAAAYSHGFYRKPRIDLALLEQHREGLVVLSGCLGSELQTRVKLGQHQEAGEYVDRMKQIFGDAFFIEMMHHGIPLEDEVNPYLYQLGKAHNVPVVLTNDSHYTTAGDADVHDALLCLQTYSKIADKDRFRFNGAGYHLSSREEMSRRPLPDEGLQRTVSIAERVCGYDSVFEHNLRLPGSGEALDYTELVAALEDRGKTGDDYIQRLSHEIDTVVGRGVSGYFVVLADLVRQWKSEGITVGPGRGSAGGSLVAYALGITALDPIREGLLFERFLDPSRVGLPDIDIDISDRRRDDAINIAIRAYGQNNVVQVGTHGTEAARVAINDAARVLGRTRAEATEVGRHLPPAKFGRSPGLDEHPYFLGNGDWTDSEKEILELAANLEGRVRSAGVHAAGVVISPVDLTDQLPLWKQTGKSNWVTQFNNKDVFPILDKMGLLKYDFLGLKALDVISECLSFLSNPQTSSSPDGCQPDLPTDSELCTDQRTFELLASGRTLGVFQLDSPGMQQLLKSLRPSKFADVAAVLALYRPGPMGVNAHHSYAKRATGREPVSYPHPEVATALEPVLGWTHGLIVYQEQLLEVLKVVAGYDMTSASSIFTAMRKKLREKLDAARPDFFERMEARGYSSECANVLWDTLVPFADYSFNKAHSVGYGLISYWTGYLKSNHPVQWMAALLSRETDSDKLKEYLDEVERMGIPILPPDVNSSLGGWTPVGGAIRYGLCSIDGVAEKAYAAIQKARPYNSLEDYLLRAPKGAINTGVLRSLIKSGSMDSLCPFREELFDSIDGLVARATDERAERKKGTVSLLRAGYDVVPAGRFNSGLRQQWEKATLGVKLTVRSVVATATRKLEIDDFEYLNDVVNNNPGQQPLSLVLGGGLSTVDLDVRFSLTKAAREAMQALGLTVEEK